MKRPMKLKYINRGGGLLHVAGAVLLLILAGACSTTSRLTEGETLYTGVKKFDIVTTDNEKLPSELLSNL